MVNQPINDTAGGEAKATNTVKRGQVRGRMRFKKTKKNKKKNRKKDTMKKIIIKKKKVI